MLNNGLYDRGSAQDGVICCWYLFIPCVNISVCTLEKRIRKVDSSRGIVIVEYDIHMSETEELTQVTLLARSGGDQALSSWLCT